MLDRIKKQIDESISTKQRLLQSEDIITNINDTAILLIKALKDNNKILFAGNGGSAADAQHLAGELVSRFYFDRPGLPSMALTTDTSILTAIGNDYGYDKLFSRQIQALGNKGDVFIGISTSGNSKNVIDALIESKNKNMITIGLTGYKVGEIDKYCDICIKVPSIDTPRIQESHILIGHILCYLIEEEIFPDWKPK
jgi:D-sedoheptulose 7-phosphate isomerase